MNEVFHNPQVPHIPTISATQIENTYDFSIADFNVTLIHEVDHSTKLHKFNLEISKLGKVPCDLLLFESDWHEFKPCEPVTHQYIPKPQQTYTFDDCIKSLQSLLHPALIPICLRSESPKAVKERIISMVEKMVDDIFVLKGASL
jgi:hypothetical protein